MNSKDPYDPSDQLGATSREFRDRPEHGWQPGDPILSHDDMQASMTYASKTARAKRERESNELARKRERSEAERRREKKKVRRVMAGAVLGTIACVHSFVPGDGLIDRVGASQSSIADTVGDALSEYETTSEFTDAAWRVEALYEQLEEEGRGAVVAAAEMYRKDHADDFVNRQTVSEMRKTLNDTDSRTKITDTFSAFMDEYGIRTEVDSDDVSLEELKSAAHSFINVLGPLPKSFVAKAKLKKIHLADVIGEGEHGSMDSTGLMELPIDHDLRNDAHAKGARLLGTDVSLEGTIAHELVHAFQNKLERKNGTGFHFGMDGDEYVGIDKYDEIENWDAIKYWMSRPDMPSRYAYSVESEFQAEVMAGVLTDSVNDLPPPAEWRRFGSQLTEYQLQALTELEALHSGIALLLIADRLV